MNHIKDYANEQLKKFQDKEAEARKFNGLSDFNSLHKKELLNAESNVYFKTHQELWDVLKTPMFIFSQRGNDNPDSLRFYSSEDVVETMTQEIEYLNEEDTIKMKDFLAQWNPNENFDYKKLELKYINYLIRKI